MIQIARESIGDIEHRRHVLAAHEPTRQITARWGMTKGIDEFSTALAIAEQFHAGSRIAERSGHDDGVSGARTGSRQYPRSRRSYDGQCQRQHRAGAHVPADQHAGIRGRRLNETSYATNHLRGAQRRWDGQREKNVARCRTHRGDVGSSRTIRTRPQLSVAQPIALKVYALDERVGRDDRFGSGAENGGVITDPDANTAAR